MIKKFLDQAIARGENLKNELTGDLLNSKFLQEVVQSDLFAKTLTTVVSAKEGVSKVLSDNVKTMLKVMDLPSRKDLTDLQNKIDHLEKTIDRVGKKSIAVKSLKKIQSRRSAHA